MKCILYFCSCGWKLKKRKSRSENAFKFSVFPWEKFFIFVFIDFPQFLAQYFNYRNLNRNRNWFFAWNSIQFFVLRFLCLLFKCISSQNVVWFSPFLVSNCHKSLNLAVIIDCQNLECKIMSVRVQVWVTWIELRKNVEFRLNHLRTSV